MQSFPRSASSLTHFKVQLLLFSYLRARFDFAAKPALPRYTLTPVLHHSSAFKPGIVPVCHLLLCTSQHTGRLSPRISSA